MTDSDVDIPITTDSQSDTIAVFRQCIPLFNALGDVNRQDIVMLLSKHEYLNVKQISEQMDLSRPAISHHLKVLRDVGLVTAVGRGTENYYSLTVDSAVERLKALIGVVESECL